MAKRARENTDPPDFGMPLGDDPESGDNAETTNEVGTESSSGNGATVEEMAARVGMVGAYDDGKKPKKTPDEKRADFKRLASGRVSRAIDALSSLLHLANTSSYEWQVSDRVRIFTALREKIDTVEAAFASAESPSEGKKKTAKQHSFRV
jgi:hypothetical protein